MKIGRIIKWALLLIFVALGSWLFYRLLDVD